MPHDYAELVSCLSDIEKELRCLNQWQINAPSVEALASKQPFCIDTLSFTQWVQFVFMPLINELIDKRKLLPMKSEISPMAQEYCKAEALKGATLIALFEQLDTLLNA